MKKDKKATIAETIFVIGIPFISAATMVFKMNQMRTQVYRELLKNKEKKRENCSNRKQDAIPSRRILITGQGSYIGEAVKKWLMNYPERYEIDTVDMIKDAWKNTNFSLYDVVYHVAGIAHADVGSVTEEQKKLYYQVNTELAVEVAKRAKESGVKQFIFMSSMIVYSGCKEKFITEKTNPKPLNF